RSPDRVVLKNGLSKPCDERKEEQKQAKSFLHSPPDYSEMKYSLPRLEKQTVPGKKGLSRVLLDDDVHGCHRTGAEETQGPVGQVVSTVGGWRTVHAPIIVKQDGKIIEEYERLARDTESFYRRLVAL